MDILQYIPEVLTFVAGGGLVGLYNIKQTKEGAKLDNAQKLVAEYKELLADYKADKERAEQNLEAFKVKYDEQIKEFNEELANVKKELAVVKTQLETSNMLYASANALKCTKINCPMRKPPLDKDALKDLVGIEEDKEESEVDNGES